MLQEEFYIAARNTVDSCIEDSMTEDMFDPENESGMNAFYKEVYDLALKGAIIAGATHEQAQKVAHAVRMEY